MEYLDPGTLPGNPPRNVIGLVLSSNWVGFVAKTWQPCGPEVRHRKQILQNNNNNATKRDEITL